ncbi:Pentatricopeptide repeat-containing protein DOT4, chloroplastic [Vitis vinifera]|uniref:Pentatricopeptide repeat-containing protein DOT4, chloroplastic n=1 Tax=Vitis vinifera TaxID=29760 RepID=A0A438KMN8_VITVI|nr:Pentatricopeptide repeat-containing protein DOT4, chloroplastic [Vitis vinifera]
MICAAMEILHTVVLFLLILFLRVPFPTLVSFTYHHITATSSHCPNLNFEFLRLGLLIGDSISLLNRCSTLSEFRQIHGRIVKLNALKWKSSIGNKLVVLYCKNQWSLEDARKLLDEIPNRTVPAYAALIRSYCRSEQWDELFSLFRLMVYEGMLPDKYLVPTILKACSAMLLLRIGKMVHGFVIRKSVESDVFVGNALIHFYSNCGDLGSSRSVFHSMQERDVVSWTALISAYMEEGLLDEAKHIFHLMQLDGVKPDLISWSALLSGFARNGEIDLALETLEEMPERGLQPTVNSLEWDYLRQFMNCLKHGIVGNVYVEGSVIDMYSKCGSYDYAEKVFVKAENKNTAMWNEMIAAYVNEGKVEDALGLLRSMQKDGWKPDVFRIMQSPSDGCNPNEVLNLSMRPNPITITGALPACADLNLWRQGKEIHGYTLRNGFEPNIFVSSALVDMYAKCHDMDSANKPEEALKLFLEMLGEGLQPSSITFMILFPACGDIAAIRFGRGLHGYAAKCQLDELKNAIASALIDMYAKCVHGMARNAFAVFVQMELLGILPDHITFVSLLSACARDGLVEEGWKYFNSMEISYGVAATLEHYTCMVGILGGAGLLDEALDFIRQMPPPDACMWATLLQACRVHSNPEIGERAAKALFELEPDNATNYMLLSNIYVSSGMWDFAKNLRSFMRGRMGQLARKMELSGYFPLDPVFDDEEKELDPFSCLHTEKLAICFGIISSNTYRPVHVSKNIRMCIDCHTSAKLISKIDGREIFVKDVCFYHHMKDGICSCQDRW